MNKEGGQNFILIGITMSILVVGIAIYLFAGVFEDEVLDRETCRQSIILRSGNFGNMEKGAIQDKIPFKCKTDVVTIDFKNVTKAAKLIADKMAECFYTYGEGEKKLYSDEWLSGKNICFDCARIHFTEDVKGYYISSRSYYQFSLDFLRLFYDKNYKRGDREFVALRDDIKRSYPEQGDITKLHCRAAIHFWDGKIINLLDTNGKIKEFASDKKDISPPCLPMKKNVLNNGDFELLQRLKDYLKNKYREVYPENNVEGTGRINIYKFLNEQKISNGETYIEYLYGDSGLLDDRLKVPSFKWQHRILWWGGEKTAEYEFPLSVGSSEDFVITYFYYRNVKHTDGTDIKKKFIGVILPWQENSEMGWGGRGFKCDKIETIPA